MSYPKDQSSKMCWLSHQYHINFPLFSVWSPLPFRSGLFVSANGSVSSGRTGSWPCLSRLFTAPPSNFSQSPFPFPFSFSHFPLDILSPAGRFLRLLTLPMRIIQLVRFDFELVWGRGHCFLATLASLPSNVLIEQGKYMYVYFWKTLYSSYYLSLIQNALLIYCKASLRRTK